jgi:hypothetical protein
MPENYTGEHLKSTGTNYRVGQVRVLFPKQHQAGIATIIATPNERYRQLEPFLGR